METEVGAEEEERMETEVGAEEEDRIAREKEREQIERRRDGIKGAARSHWFFNAAWHCECGHNKGGPGNLIFFIKK